MMQRLIDGDNDRSAGKPRRREKYYSVFRRAQSDLDLHAHRYTRFNRREFSIRFHDQMDTCLFGPGDRIVCEPYDEVIYQDTLKWFMERGIFPKGDPVVRDYENSFATAVK